MWGPLVKQDFEKWDNHQMETLHTEICKSILRVHRNTPNNGCPNFYHYKALHLQEEKIERSPNWTSQLVLRLTSSNSTRPLDHPHTEKENYINYWTSTTTTQSKLPCYLALNRQYTVTEYLTTRTDETLRKTFYFV